MIPDRSVVVMQLLVALTAMLLGARPALQAAQTAAAHVSPITVTSSSFQEGARIPTEFTCAAGTSTHSPELRWSGVPPEAASIVLYFHDLDPHPNGHIDDVLHWMVWNIPATSTGLPSGVKTEVSAIPGAVQGINTHGAVGYFGPCPPPGQPDHHYVFEVFALSKSVQLPEKATRHELMEAMDGSIVGHGVLMALFSRKS